MTGGAQDSGVNPDLSWIDIAVTHSKEVLILGYSEFWKQFDMELWWGDTFSTDAPEHLTPGAYRWTGYVIGSWDEGEHLAVSGGDFSPIPAATAPAGWQPRIGEEVRVSEETAERWPDWRDTRLWVVGVSMDRNVSGTPTEGLNVCVSDEWPVTNRTGGFTDGFYINRPYAGDDLRPIPTAPAEGGV